ncbi:MAG: MYXO-CTERM sorting domain-containing protein, partial [Bradymonadaceae bacterium]
WTGDGSILLLWNDDDPNERTLSSVLDTGVLPTGRYCFAVSTFGDADWSGAQQQSAGRYTFGLEMGNRPPTIEVSYEDTPVPTAPETILVDEGDELVFHLVFDDPDGDALQPEVIHLDNAGQDVQGALVQAAGGTTYTWTPATTAARASPYVLTFRVSDGEFSAEVVTTVEVDAVNLPPTTPVLDSPIGAVRVDVAEVPLVIINSTDPNEDALTYEFELHEGSPFGDADQTGSVAEDASGMTTWTTGAITENARVSWRARAFDGDVDNGYSPWSEWETFMVDTVNDPPPAPEILKPFPNEFILVPNPRISSTVPEDPEGDAVSITFEVATESGFNDIVASSDPVEATDASTTVEWTTSPPLAGDTRYYVRARATDDRGAESPWSETVSFNIGSGELAGPTFPTNFESQCEEGYVIRGPITALSVANIDQSGDTLSFQLQILRGDETVYDVTVAQSRTTHTQIPIEAGVFAEEGHYSLRLRTLSGDVSGEWHECRAIVPGPNTDTGANVESTGEGCGCASVGGGPEGAGWVAFLLLLVVGYRKRRK